jgi:hypothetical protein
MRGLRKVRRYARPLLEMPRTRLDRAVQPGGPSACGWGWPINVRRIRGQPNPQMNPRHKRYPEALLPLALLTSCERYPSAQSSTAPDATSTAFSPPSPTVVEPAPAPMPRPTEWSNTTPLLAAAPDEVRRWLGAAPRGQEILHPYGRSGFLLTIPDGARIEAAPPGYAGWWALVALSGHSAMKLRRTATLHDPNAMFDRYPKCATMDTVRARVAGAKIVLDRSWTAPLQPGSCEAKIELLVYEDRDGVGFYTRTEYRDYIDRVSQESFTTACCAPGALAQVERMRGHLPERAAREHVAACLTLRADSC